jgi:hypothetical protein
MLVTSYPHLCKQQAYRAFASSALHFLLTEQQFSRLEEKSSLCSEVPHNFPKLANFQAVSGQY